MKRVVTLAAHGTSQRIAALANFLERLQARALGNREGELVRRGNDRDGAQRDRRRERSRAAHGESQVAGRITDRQLHFGFGNLTDRRRSVAGKKSYRPIVSALWAQAHARLAVKPLRLID